MKSFDQPLLIGAMIFGIGWGLAGYCPGPALAGLALGNEEVLVFLGAMLCGGLLQQWWARNWNDGQIMALPAIDSSGWTTQRSVKMSEPRNRS